MQFFFLSLNKPLDEVFPFHIWSGYRLFYGPWNHWWAITTFIRGPSRSSHLLGIRDEIQSGKVCGLVYRDEDPLDAFEYVHIDLSFSFIFHLSEIILAITGQHVADVHIYTSCFQADVSR